MPYLTASYAGAGGFTVSPILGYQEGGSTANGTPNTTSRQFQAGLNVTGQGASQASTLFVMTSQISNAPNIGYAQGGGVSVVTYQPSVNSVGYHTSLAISSAASASSTNSVPTDANGTPNGSYTISNATVDLNSGAVSSSAATNFPSGTYTFNPITTGTPTQVTANHPAQNLQGYVGGLMQSAYINPINSTNLATYSSPYIVTNATGNPGDVSVSLPGNSSQVGVTLNVASVNARRAG